MAAYSPWFWTFAASTALFTLLMVAFERRGPRKLIWVLKPLASLSFVLAAIAAQVTTTRPGSAVLVALILSFAGDVLLIPASKRMFTAGLASFLVGHLAFAVAFFLRGVSVSAFAIALAAVSVSSFVAARWLLPHVEAKMKTPVISYIVVITVMVAAAAGTYAAHGEPLFLAAAVAFYCSDLSVARDRFVAPGFINRAWGLPLYYGAQILFAAAAAWPYDHLC